MRKFLWFIIFIIIVTALISMFSFFPKSKGEVVATHDFSCAGMEGFTFQYPVFKGWEPSLARQLTPVDGVCSIFLNHPEGIAFEVASRITVTKQAYGEHDFEIPVEAISHPNPHTVPYILTHDQNSGEFVTFYIPGFKVFIDIESTSEKYGFSKDMFWKKIIETFQITK